LAAKRGSGVDTGRQRLDLNNDQVKRILGYCGSLSNYNSDRFTDIAYFSIGDHRLLVGREVGERCQTQRDSGHRTANIGSRDDSDDARQRQGRPRIQAQDVPVWDGAA